MKIYELGDFGADIIIIQPVDDHDLQGINNEFSFLLYNCQRSIRLIAVRVDDWNDELSPWKAPAVFGKTDFGGKASATLQEMLKLCNDPSKQYYIGGYSLAGLFALWAAYQIDVFKGVAAASPSLWFPGFIDFMKENRIRSDTVYLSLGDKEERTRNPVMATIGRNIREAYELLEAQGVNCCLEWNEGNHFKDADIRTAKAFAWLIQE